MTDNYHNYRNVTSLQLSLIPMLSSSHHYLSECFLSAHVLKPQKTKYAYFAILG